MAKETPEGRVKKKVKEVLNKFGEDVWFSMPVPSGYGESLHDFVVCFYGRFISIETKAKDGIPLTPRQIELGRRMIAAGGVVLRVDDRNVHQLEQYLLLLKK